MDFSYSAPHSLTVYADRAATVRSRFKFGKKRDLQMGCNVSRCCGGNDLWDFVNQVIAGYFKNKCIPRIMTN